MKSAWTFLNVSDPLVAWECYRGELISCESQNDPGFKSLSLWWTRLLQDFEADRTKNEFLLEHIRRSEYPSLVSRIKGMYYFRSKDIALKAVAYWGRRDNYFNEDCLTEVRFIEEPQFSTLDSGWITDKIGKFTADTSWMRHYWAGEKSQSKYALEEMIVNGRAIILNKKLRERSYEAIKERAPESLALLELARVSVDLGSDLGHIVSVCRKNLFARKLEFRYLMDIRDGKNKDFLRRFHDYDGPKNTQDLNPSKSLKTMDLKRYFFDKDLSNLDARYI